VIDVLILRERDYEFLTRLRRPARRSNAYRDPL
jgi:hypothetical protein